MALPGAAGATAAAAAAHALAGIRKAAKYEFVHDVGYWDVPFAPGNASCWSEGYGGAAAAVVEEEQKARETEKQAERSWQLSFERCCSSYRPGDETCWSAGQQQQLSFDACCGRGAFAPLSSTHTPEEPLPQQPVERRKRQKRAVIALTTTPHRLGKLGAVLESLLHQTYGPSAVYLSLPYVFARDWQWYEFPWWYAEMEELGLRILRCEQDYRPQTALLCMLEHEPDPLTYILLVNDDMVYHPTHLEEMMMLSDRSPGAMIGAFSLGAAGSWCLEFDENGRCLEPNLAHGFGGKLFQRGFFDASVFNYAAAANALQRTLRAEKVPARGFILAACMHADLVWHDAHLARKGIPRVFLRNNFGSKMVFSTAYAPDSLLTGFAGARRNFFSAADPHTNEEAHRVCNRALRAWHGASLWSARARVVFATLLGGGSLGSASDTGATSRSDVAELDTALGRAHGGDVLVAFACSGRSLARWRRELAPFGGLASRTVYLSRYRFEHLPSDRESHFESEPFDPVAFVVPPLRVARDGHGFEPTGERVSGHSAAGLQLPLLNVVELCDEKNGESAGAGDGSDATPAAAARALDGCPDATVVREACGPEPWVANLSIGVIASVQCCRGSGRRAECVDHSRARNSSGSVGMCLPHFARFWEAQRICEILQLDLCDARAARRCCRRPCRGDPSASIWVRSPAATSCLRERRSGLADGTIAREAQAPERVQQRPPTAQQAPDRAELLRRADAYLRLHEAAASTVVTWL